MAAGMGWRVGDGDEPVADRVAVQLRLCHTPQAAIAEAAGLSQAPAHKYFEQRYQQIRTRFTRHFSATLLGEGVAADHQFQWLLDAVSRHERKLRSTRRDDPRHRTT